MQQQKALQLLESMKHEAEDMAKLQRQQVQETLALIEAEINKPQLNGILTRALVANLRPYDSLNLYRRRLADLLDVELI